MLKMQPRISLTCNLVDPINCHMFLIYVRINLNMDMYVEGLVMQVTLQSYFSLTIVVIHAID